MEKITKIDAQLKIRLAKIVGCKWHDVRIVLFELNGIDVYYGEYGTHKKIGYDDIKD